jgi:archaellin
MSFVDPNVIDYDLEYTTVALTGDADQLLEPGELLLVTIDLTAQTNGPVFAIGANQTFTIEVKPPSGSYMVIQRSTPPSVNEPIINLY